MRDITRTPVLAPPHTTARRRTTVCNVRIHTDHYAFPLD